MTKKLTIIIYTLVFMVIFLVVGFYAIRTAYYRLQDSLIIQYGEEELLLAKQTARILADEVKSFQSKLSLIAEIPQIKNGNELECNQKIAEILALNTRISNIGRVNIEMKFHCSFNKALIGTDATKLGSYIKDIFNDSSHKPVVSRLVKLPNGSFAVATHVAVYNEQKEFIGTVGGAIYFDELGEKYLKDIKLSANGYVVVEDDDGTIFYHPDKTLIGQKRWPITPEQDATASALTKSLMKSAKDGSEGVSRYYLNGQEKVAAYTPIQITPDRKWLVLVTVPIEDIEGWALFKESRLIFTILFFVLFGSIIIPPSIILLYLIHSVFKPLERIGTVAKEIGQGNLDVSVLAESNDEIGTLAKIINDMVFKLKSSYEGLEAKINEKTNTLTQKLEELEKTKTATLNIMQDLEESKNEIEKEKMQDEALLSSIGDGVFAIDKAKYFR